MKKVMTEGNRKCKDMWIFTLPAIKSCPNHKDCAEDCYALKAERMYKSAREHREEMFDLAKHNISKLEDLLRTQFDTEKFKVCRIHESGDFFNQKYLDMWVRIATNYPNIKFFGFTKTYRLFDFKEANKLPNMNILNSYLFGKYLNFGSKEYVKTLMKKYPEIFLCPSSAKEGEAKCNIDCTYCIDGGRHHIGVQHYRDPFCSYIVD